MTKFILDQVAENARFIALCPACSQSPGLADTPTNQMGPGSNGLHKRGRKKGLYRKSMPVCQFCKGRGIVYLNRICECAMPAVLYDEKRKVWYCGVEECAKSASWRLGLHEFKNSGGSSSGGSASGAMCPMGPGGPEVDASWFGGG